MRASYTLTDLIEYIKTLQDFYELDILGMTHKELNHWVENKITEFFLETKLKDVYYNKDDKKYSLKEYIKTIDDVKEITSLLEDYRSYDDGGSQLFSSKEYDLSILICNKINGTSDIYIGDSNMTYSGTMCK